MARARSIIVTSVFVAFGGVCAALASGPTPQATSSTPTARAADTRPLPDVTQLLRQVNKNQAAIDQIRKLYTAHLSEENDDTDSNGNIKSRTVKDYDVFYVGGDEVRHLLAENGNPLEGKQKQHEDDRFNKDFDDKKKKQSELAADPKKAAKEDEQDDAQLSDFLRAELFTNPRRTTFRGEDVIAFDFAGNPNYKPKKEVDRIIQKVSGVMWVDDQASEIVRLEGHFTDAAHIAGGVVASLQKGSSFVFEQDKINNEVWLPSYVEIHMAARVVIVKVRANFVDRYTDYRKFQSQSRISAATPN